MVHLFYHFIGKQSQILTNQNEYNHNFYEFGFSNGNIFSFFHYVSFLNTLNTIKLTSVCYICQQCIESKQKKKKNTSAMLFPLSTACRMCLMYIVCARLYVFVFVYVLCIRLVLSYNIFVFAYVLGLCIENSLTDRRQR